MSNKYKKIQEETSLVSEPKVAYGTENGGFNYNTNISPIDALWAIYKTQTKQVRKAFRQRLLAEEQEQSKKKQELMVRESLKQAFSELHSGQVKHDARKLFTK